MNELEWLTELKNDIAKQLRMANTISDPVKKIGEAIEVFSEVVDKINNRINELTSEEEE